LVFGLAILPLMFAFALFLAFAKDAPGSRRAQKGSDYVALLKDGDTFRFCLFYGVTFGGFSGLISFMPIFLHDQYSASMVLAGDLTSFCVLSGSLMRPLGGWLADKVGGIRVLAGLYAAIALLLLGAAQLPSLA